MNRTDTLNEIKKITSKYRWDYNEEQKVNHLLKIFGQEEFESALVIKDAILINRLEEVVKSRCLKLIFNHDDAYGFFVEVQRWYHESDIVVADLKLSTKRETLRDAILAAIQYLES